MIQTGQQMICVPISIVDGVLTNKNWTKNSNKKVLWQIALIQQWDYTIQQLNTTKQNVKQIRIKSFLIMEM